MKKQFKKFFIWLAKLSFFGYVFYILISQQPLIDAKETEKTQLEKQLYERQKIEIELKTDIETADSMQYIEEVAKEKLGMLKPGERVFIDIKK
ncbi:MAG: septum formation initiator family protein [Clostridia bacterium]|nr:septum formation initiator family protein [Clostridia bacterium]